LLAVYLSKTNSEGDHDFVLPSDVDGIGLLEGFWSAFLQSPERQAQVAANQISYAWDALIEKFVEHLLAGSQYFASHPSIGDQEQTLRLLAREPRTRRRMLAKKLLNLIERTPGSHRATSVFFSSNPCYPYYIFLLLPRTEDISYAEYREFRLSLLEMYCKITKLQFPEARHIIGIATESGLIENRSEDVIYYDANEFSEEERIEARHCLETLKSAGMLGERTKFSAKELEYPMRDHHVKKKTLPASEWPTSYPRNKTCPCGSGKKYKYCCGRRF
jgi:hypothetical protein